MSAQGLAWWQRPAGRASGAAAPGGTLPFAALLAFTFILIISPQSFVPALEPLRIALLAAGLALAGFVGSRLVARRPLLESSTEMVLACTLAGWSLITVPLALWPGGSVAMLFGVYLKTLVIFWLLAHAVDTRRRLHVMAWALSLMAVPLALTALENYLSGEFMSDRRIAGYDAALTANPNDLALMLNLLLPLTVALFLTAKNRSARVLLGAMIVLDAVAVVVTYSRTGFLTLGVIAAIYLAKMFRRRHYGAVLAIVALMCAAVPLMPADYVQRLATITDIEADASGSAQGRWNDSLAALEFTAANPVFGAGIGNNALALNSVRGEKWLHVHNVYLQVAVDLGLPGMLLFIALLAACMRSAGAARRRAAGRPDAQGLYRVAEGLQVSLAAFAFAALFHPVAYHYYFYLFAGLAVAARSIALDHG